MILTIEVVDSGNVRVIQVADVDAGLEQIEHIIWDATVTLGAFNLVIGKTVSETKVLLHRFETDNRTSRDDLTRASQDGGDLVPIRATIKARTQKLLLGRIALEMMERGALTP